MASEWVAGFNAKATVNSVAYAFATYRVRASVTDQDVSNSEGMGGSGQVGNIPAAECRIPGLGHLETMVRRATFDILNNPFAAPIELMIGKYFDVAVLTSSVGPAWAAPYLLVLDTDMDGDVKSLQPFSFSGKSDGDFEIGGVAYSPVEPGD